MGLQLWLHCHFSPDFPCYDRKLPVRMAGYICVLYICLYCRMDWCQGTDIPQNAHGWLSWIICRLLYTGNRIKIRVRLIEVNAKCRNLKIWAWKGTLRQVFIRVYRLEMAIFLRTFSHVGIFNPGMWSVLSPVAPLSSLWFNSPPSSLPCVDKYTVYT
jgi:hypothetical protein